MSARGPQSSTPPQFTSPSSVQCTAAASGSSCPGSGQRSRPEGVASGNRGHHSSRHSHHRQGKPPPPPVVCGAVLGATPGEPSGSHYLILDVVVVPGDFPCIAALTTPRSSSRPATTSVVVVSLSYSASRERLPSPSSIPPWPHAATTTRSKTRRTAPRRLEPLRRYQSSRWKTNCPCS